MVSPKEELDRLRAVIKKNKTHLFSAQDLVARKEKSIAEMAELLRVERLRSIELQAELNKLKADLLPRNQEYELAVQALQARLLSESALRVEAEREAEKYVAMLKEVALQNAADERESLIRLAKFALGQKRRDREGHKQRSSAWRERLLEQLDGIINRVEAELALPTNQAVTVM